MSNVNESTTLIVENNTESRQIVMKNIQPDLTVVTEQARRLTRTGVLTILIFVGGFFIWAGFAPLSGAVIAPGIIKLDMNRKKIQHLEGGIVREIWVKEGSLVQQGQSLLALEDIRSSADLNVLSHEWNVLLAKESRLLAEQKLSEHVDFSAELNKNKTPEILEIIKNEQGIFASRRKSLLDQIDFINQEISHANANLNSLLNQANALNESMSYAKHQLNATEELLAQNYVQQADIWKLKGGLADKNEQLAQIQANQASVRERLTELKLRVVTVKNEYLQQVDADLKQTRQELAAVREKMRPAQDTQQRHIVKAPISGQVINLNVSTIGEVIQPGKDLMEIVPESQTLIIEAQIKTDDIDVVHIGHDSDIQLSAFNRRTTPLIKGQVSYISGDAIKDESDAHNIFYRAYIKADNSSNVLLEELGLKLTPGMPAVAFIKTRSRTFFDYIMEPIIGFSRKTLRETS